MVMHFELELILFSGCLYARFYLIIEGDARIVVDGFFCSRVIAMSVWPLQGSHSHGKSGKVMEIFVVMESHVKSWKITKIPKVMEK